MEDVTSDMTADELREWLAELELSAQDAWTTSEITSLRKERDMVRTALAKLEGAA